MELPVYLTFLFGGAVCGTVGFYLLLRGLMRLSSHKGLAIAALIIGAVLTWWAGLYICVLFGILTPSTYSIYARYGLPFLCLGIYYLARKVGL